MIEENFGETDDAEPGAGTDVTDEMSAEHIERLIEENKHVSMRIHVWLFYRVVICERAHSVQRLLKNV